MQCAQSLRMFRESSDQDGTVKLETWSQAQALVMKKSQSNSTSVHRKTTEGRRSDTQHCLMKQ